MLKYAKVTSSTGKLLTHALEDGATHINIYSHGRTDLGRRLSNFTRNPFHHPKHGYFESMEGFWYWLATGMIHDALRTKIGFDAKAYGRSKPRVPIEDFEAKVLDAIRVMLSQNPKLYQDLLNSTLPFTHYYCYANTLKDNPSALFLLTEYDLIRNGKPLTD